LRRTDPGPCGGSGRAKHGLRIGAVLPLALVGNTVWRIKRRPVWNMSAAEGRPYFSFAEGQVPGADRASPEITCRPPQGPDIGVCRLKTVPGMEVPSGPNAARAWNRPHFSGRAPRWLL